MEEQYVIALYEGDEDYEDVEDCLKDVLKEMRELQKDGIDLDGVHVDVEMGRLL